MKIGLNKNTRVYRIGFMFVLMLYTGLLMSQEQLLINAYSRPALILDGDWNYIVDPYENGFYNYRLDPFENHENPGNGAYFTNAKPADKSDLVEYDFDKSDIIRVPGDWNTQKEKLFYYEGTVWYKRSFDFVNSENQRTFIYFEAVNYQADVYLNGKKLGKHIGGFTPFNFEVTDLLKKKDNFLIVKVDNKRLKDGVPTLNTDWWNYGGITRSVKLISTPVTFIQDYFIQLDQEDNQKIVVEIQLNGPDVKNKKVEINIPELQIGKEIS